MLEDIIFNFFEEFNLDPLELLSDYGVDVTYFNISFLRQQMRFLKQQHTLYRISIENLNMYYRGARQASGVSMEPLKLSEPPRVLKTYQREDEFDSDCWNFHQKYAYLFKLVDISDNPRCEETLLRDLQNFRGMVEDYPNHLDKISLENDELWFNLSTFSVPLRWYHLFKPDRLKHIMVAYLKRESP